MSELPAALLAKLVAEHGARGGCQTSPHGLPLCSETGIVAKAFNSETVIQMFLLARDVPTDTWSGN